MFQRREEKKHFKKSQDNKIGNKFYTMSPSKRYSKRYLWDQWIYQRNIWFKFNEWDMNILLTILPKVLKKIVKEQSLKSLPYKRMYFILCGSLYGNHYPQYTYAATSPVLIYRLFFHLGHLICKWIRVSESYWKQGIIFEHFLKTDKI